MLEIPIPIKRERRADVLTKASIVVNIKSVRITNLLRTKEVAKIKH